MGRMSGWSVGALVAVLALRAPAGWAGTASDELVYLAPTDIATLDGAFVTDAVANGVMRNIHNNLVKLNQHLEIQPDAATRWEVSPDKRTWIFSLRPGIKFSDGTPLTAAAVKFTIERILDPATAAPNRVYFAEVERVEAVDELTLKITTRAPFPDLLLNLTQRGGAILNPPAVKKWPVREYGLHPMGSGPFMVAEWSPGQRIVLERNPHYWGPKPKLRRVVFRPIPDSSVRMAMLKTGEGDLDGRVPPENIEPLRADPNMTVLQVPTTMAMTYEILTDRKPLDDVRVRKALNYAIDRDAIIRNILAGQGVPNCSPVGPGVGKAFYFSLECYRYDPGLAKKLLAEAGQAGGFTIDLWAPNGRWLKDREVTEAVQAYWKAIGVSANVRFWEWGPYLKAWSAKDRQTWMMGRNVAGVDYTFSRMFTKAEWDRGANNNTRFYDPKVEEQIKEARTEFDPASRAGLYRQVEAAVWDYAPAVYLYVEKRTVAMRRNVRGLVVIPTEELLFEEVSKD